jgi:protein-S-isoprenylcysteine O-methyltransferase Ste14
MKNLEAKAWLALAVLAVVMALLLFVPAETIHYWQASVYLGIFAGASALTTVYLIRKDLALLERRMSGGPTAEKQPTQKFIMLCVSIGFIALLVVPGLDHRFGWSAVPLAVVVAGDVLVAIGSYLISRVYRENTFTSATIEVAENQKVISTGPYALVRHPMYASASLYLLGTPLALGSRSQEAAMSGEENKVLVRRPLERVREGWTPAVIEEFFAPSYRRHLNPTTAPLTALGQQEGASRLRAAHRFDDCKTQRNLDDRGWALSHGENDRRP